MFDFLNNTGGSSNVDLTGAGTDAALNSAGVPTPEQLAEFNKVLDGYVNVIGDLANTYVKHVNNILGALDCWGASWTPDKAKKFVRETTTQAAQSLIRMLEVYPNASQIDVINAWFVSYHNSYKMNIAYVDQGGAKDCTRRSLIGLISAMELSYAEFMSVVVDFYTDMGYECTLYDVRNDDNEGKWKQQHRIKQIRVKYVGRIGGVVKKQTSALFWLLLPITGIVLLVRFLMNSNGKKGKGKKVKIKIKNRNG